MVAHLPYLLISCRFFKPCQSYWSWRRREFDVLQVPRGLDHYIIIVNEVILLMFAKHKWRRLVKNLRYINAVFFRAKNWSNFISPASLLLLTITRSTLHKIKFICQNSFVFICNWLNWEIIRHYLAGRFISTKAYCLSIFLIYFSSWCTVSQDSLETSISLGHCILLFRGSCKLVASFRYLSHENLRRLYIARRIIWCRP